MENIFKTLDDGYIKYKNNIINVIVDNDDIVWFSAKESAKALGYANHINAIKQHTKNKDRLQLRYIDANNKTGHPHSLYFTEAGLYKLILRSKLPAAEKFSDWVTYDVLPSIRKYGYYKLSGDYEKIIKNLNIKLKRLSTAKINVDKENILLKQDLRKEIFPKGGLVYAIDFSTDTEEVYRVGMTMNMKNRKEVINSHTLHKQPVAFYLETNCPRQLETCIRCMLYDFRYMDRKDFFICSLQRIKMAFRSCARNITKMKNKSCSGSKTSKNQKGGNKFTLINTRAISQEITNTMLLRDKTQKKINKLNKIIYE